ncbi:MAG: hypothetical protein E6R04_11380 [Spirochaetes bacterium]|nr:MAG: hypothetical protein E6R04_11380 [Spirochaetota bacterium]
MSEQVNPSRQVRRAAERARLRSSFNKKQRRMFTRLPTPDKRAIVEMSRMIASRSHEEEAAEQPDEVIEVAAQ